MKKFKTRFFTCLLTALIGMMAFSTTAFAGGPDYVEPTEEATESGEPLSEESDISTRDLLYDKATNKQFITIIDRDGNIFYLVIDYDSPVNEDEEQYKTYFLNPVDTDDLKALAEEADTTPVACTCTDKCVAGAIEMDCPICASDMTECAGKTPESVATEEPATVEVPVETTSSNNNLNPAVLVLLLALIGGGGAFAYIKLVKNKPKTKGNTDLDDYDYGDDEDDADDTPWESEEEKPEPADEETAEDTDD